MKRFISSLSLLSFSLLLVAHSAAAQNAAAPAASAAGGGSIGGLIPYDEAALFVLIFMIFYFLLIRPQQKRLKEHQKMVQGLKRNDKVSTAGGIVGTVTKVNADNKTLEIKIADNVEVTVLREMVTDLLNPKAEEAEKATPAVDKKGKKK